MVSVLIADNNTELCNIIERYLAYQPELEVLGSVYNGLDAVKKVREQRPDLLILDIGLPLLDGLGVLDNLKGELPKVLVITAFSKEEIIQAALNKGASYCLIKPFYLSVLEERIRDIIAKEEQVVMDTSLVGIQLEDNFILNKIENLLNELGIRSNLKGYEYLRDILYLTSKNKALLVDGLTKNLYPNLAKRYNTSSEAVEAAIRGALNSAWNQNANGFMAVFPKSRRDCPTNAQFIILARSEVLKRLQHN